MSFLPKGIVNIRSASSHSYLDGRNPEHEGLDTLFLTDRSPVADKYLQWELIPYGKTFAIKSVSSGNYLDGRSYSTAPPGPRGNGIGLTNRNPHGDNYLQWEIILYDRGIALKSVSSHHFLDGRAAGATGPVVYLTSRDPKLDAQPYLLWEITSAFTTEVSQTDVGKAFQKEWLGGKITNQVYADRTYVGLSSHEAVGIWKESQVGNFKWTKESFDCDDFSYVYKGAVSKHVYQRKKNLPYAVGIIFGRNSKGGHAVNVFLDELGNVKILEPQNGKIVDGKDWEYDPYFVLM